MRHGQTFVAIAWRMEYSRSTAFLNRFHPRTVLLGEWFVRSSSAAQVSNTQ